MGNQMYRMMKLANEIDNTVAKYKICSECGSGLTCGSTDDGKLCWCDSYPAFMPENYEQDCRCSKCLSIAINEKISEFIARSSKTDIIAIAKHYRGRKDIEGIDYHIENGRFVFTAWSHYKRGTCCKNSCTNCPY